MAKPKTLLLTALMIGIGLAGCIGGDDGGIQGDDAPTGPQFSEDTGAVRGTVTDAELLPVEGAQVAILNLETGITTTTDDSGTFILSNVPPGTHTLAVQKLGFESLAKKLDVIAGGETFVEITLDPVPVEEPYVESLPHAGQYGTGAAIVRTTLCLGCNDPERAWFMFGGLPDDFAGLVAEAEWETEDYFGFDFLARSDYCGEDGETSCMWYRTRSQSPMHFFAEPCGDYTGDPYYGRSPVPCDQETFEQTQGTDPQDGDVARLETWYLGLLQDEAHTLDPVCQIPVPTPIFTLPGYEQGCYGVGLAPETRWNTWVSIFHLELPAGAESYTAFPDA